MDTARPTLTHRPAGICVVTVAGLLILSGLVTFSPQLLSLGLLTTFVWGTSRFLAAKALSGLVVNRTLPRRAAVGESFPVKTTLSNGNRFIAVPEFEIRDPLADSALEEKKPLVPGEEKSLTYTGKRTRRGRIKRQHWRSISTWPLGLFEAEMIGPFIDTQSPLVIPKPFLPPHLQRYIENLQEDVAHSSFAPPDPSAEFKYLREFRHGDSLKSIHWPTSLRTDELLIREPEPPSPRPRRFGILVHSFSPSGKIETPETFEMILRIVAGLLFYFRSCEVEVRYQVLPHGLTLLRDSRDFSAAIDQLALQSRDPLSSHEKIIAAAESFHDCDDLFVVSDCPISEWKQSLSSARVPLACIDSVSLSSASRPKLRTRKRLQPL